MCGDKMSLHRQGHVISEWGVRMNLASLVHGGFSFLLLALLPQHVHQVGGYCSNHGRVSLLLLQVLQHLLL